MGVGQASAVLSIALEVEPCSRACVDAVCVFVMRFTPSHTTTDGDNKATAPTDFAVEYEHRASDKLKRPDVIEIVAKAVPQPPYKVNLSNPDRTILVQAVRNAAAISVVSSFRGLAKYNLRRLVELEEEADEGGKGQGGEGGENEEEEEQEGKAAAAAAPAAGDEEKAGDKAADAAADADKSAEPAAAAAPEPVAAAAGADA